MSDLISRSEAVQMLIQETVYSKNNLIHINTVKRLLQDVDTAYSVDKVVEELQRESYAIMLDGALVASKEVVIDAKRATEIVKQGGKEN